MEQHFGKNSYDDCAQAQKRAMVQRLLSEIYNRYVDFYMICHILLAKFYCLTSHLSGHPDKLGLLYPVKTRQVFSRSHHKCFFFW